MATTFAILGRIARHTGLRRKEALDANLAKWGVLVRPCSHKQTHVLPRPITAQRQDISEGLRTHDIAYGPAMKQHPQTYVVLSFGARPDVALANGERKCEDRITKAGLLENEWLETRPSGCLGELSPLLLSFGVGY